MLKFAGTISTDDLEIMQQAIEEDCGLSSIEKHFGTLKLETAIAIDNESIDADLAKGYADNHTNLFAAIV